MHWANFSRMFQSEGQHSISGDEWTFIGHSLFTGLGYQVLRGSRVQEIEDKTQLNGEMSQTKMDIKIKRKNTYKSADSCIQPAVVSINWAESAHLAKISRTVGAAHMHFLVSAGQLKSFQILFDGAIYSRSTFYFWQTQATLLFLKILMEAKFTYCKRNMFPGYNWMDIHRSRQPRSPHPRQEREHFHLPRKIARSHFVFKLLASECLCVEIIKAKCAGREPNHQSSTANTGSEGSGDGARACTDLSEGWAL